SSDLPTGRLGKRAAAQAGRSVVRRARGFEAVVRLSRYANYRTVFGLRIGRTNRGVNPPSECVFGHVGGSYRHAAGRLAGPVGSAPRGGPSDPNSGPYCGSAISPPRRSEFRHVKGEPTTVARRYRNQINCDIAT